ncbi:MAG: hypothetical protein J6Q30_02535 [Oscillospiraceae bacterium]|nr:hypothetical protein [Oscillospiraceae bacterium]
MTEKKWLKPVIILLAVVLIVLVLLWHNSFSLMLRVNGLNPGKRDLTYLAELDESRSIGGEAKIFQTTTKDGELALGVARKNKLGIWRMETMEVTTDENRFIHISWIEPTVMRQYEGKDAGREQGWHFIYCGDDAVDLVELHEEQLPENAAVKIEQMEGFYLIYIVVYGDEGFHLAVHEALEENGCVKPLS